MFACVKTPKIPQAHISYHRFCLVLPAIYFMFFFISLSHWGCWWDTIKFFPEHWLSEDDQLPESNRHNEKCSAKHFDTHWPYWPFIAWYKGVPFLTISQMVNGADGNRTRVQKHYLKILFTLLAWSLWRNILMFLWLHMLVFIPQHLPAISQCILG